MQFNSMSFIFAFLPLTIALYFLSKSTTYRNVVLLLASIVFYAWGDLGNLALMLVVTLVNYLLVMAMSKCEDKQRKSFLLTVVLLNVIMLGFYKYTNFSIENLNYVFRSEIKFIGLALPLGISFFTFRIISYAVDVYQNKIPVETSLLRMSLYTLMFPMIISGPIVRYETIANEMKSRRVKLDDLTIGVQRFIIGLGKKVLIANQVAYIASEVFKITDFSKLTSTHVFIGVLSYTLQVYFDFSGYSDMAIGVARIFGFNFLENFNYPYIAKSATEFWRRWHISLSTWFRDYIYIPLGGNRVPFYRWVLNIAIVWMVTGLWHGAAWSFVFWGIYFGVILIIEKLFLSKWLIRLPVLNHIYTLIVVMISWIIFNSSSLTQILVFIKRIIVVRELSFDVLISLNFGTYWPYYILGIVFSTPIVKWLEQKFQSSAVFTLIKNTTIILIFVLSLIYMIDGSYNPFIYFKF